MFKLGYTINDDSSTAIIFQIFITFYESSGTKSPTEPLAFELDRISLGSHIGIDSNLLFKSIPKVELDNSDFQIFEATLVFIYDATPPY